MLIGDDQRIAGATQMSSPNVGGPLVAPRFIVMHFTGGRSFERSCGHLCNPKSKASAHAVIARDARVAQLVPFDTVAWHAGASTWHTASQGYHERFNGLNRHSIGIELDNFGKLKQKGRFLTTWFGQEVDRDLAEACDDGFWHAYSPEQLDVALEVCEALRDAYPSIEGIVGHSDITPGRKVDPGPAFPMSQFRSQLFGRAEET